MGDEGAVKLKGGREKTERGEKMLLKVTREGRREWEREPKDKTG